MAKPKKNKPNKSLGKTPSSQNSPTSSNISSIAQSKPKVDNQPKGFKFISNTNSVHLKCPICQELMIRPMRIHPCGHTFCQKCIDPFMQLNKKNCPFKNCLRKFQIIQNDRTAQNLIDELKVQCTNEPCVYKGVYEHYKKQHKDTCAFKNGGIDAWLGNLTQGLVLTQRTSQLAQKFIDDYSHDQSQKPDYLEKPIEQNQNEESQNIEIVEYAQKEVEKQENTQKKQKINERKQDYDGENKEKEQKSVQKSVQNPHSINNSSSDLGMSLNFSIFNIPFGPSIRQQMNSENIRSNEFMEKEIKKLQG